eukprot:Skav206431  [mRNA]  locus=scaffold292:770721:774411:- [translate_table: standard]
MLEELSQNSKLKKVLPRQFRTSTEGGALVRRSLVAAGFAVVGASNAEIAARIVARASVTFDEALAATDGVAERVSVTLGESLLQMVVDTTTPPPSPKELRSCCGNLWNCWEVELGDGAWEDLGGRPQADVNNKGGPWVNNVCFLDRLAKIDAWLARRRLPRPPPAAVPVATLAVPLPTTLAVPAEKDEIKDDHMLNE